jgi:hypothetical protein
VNEEANGISSTTLATEREQFAFDQSLANSENAGMSAVVLGNVFLLLVIVAGILFITSRKKSRKEQ